GDSLGLLDQMFDCLDEPFGDYSAIPTYAICKLARTKATVLLTGDGGDEVFGGYTRYIWSRGWRGLLAKAYGGFRRHKLWPPPSHVALETYRRLLTLDSPRSSLDADLLLHYMGGIDDKLSLSTLQYLRLFDFQFYLPDDILVKTDRMSMANSTELRS